MTQDIIAALAAVRANIRWRGRSLERHFRTRKKREHLPPDATIDDYEYIIRQVLHDGEANVYLYTPQQTSYIYVTSVVQGYHWLAIFSFDGIMESAFIVERPQNYFNKPEVEFISKLDELIS